jgi:hypothetical protein
MSLLQQGRRRCLAVGQVLECERVLPAQQQVAVAVSAGPCRHGVWRRRLQRGALWKVVPRHRLHPRHVHGHEPRTRGGRRVRELLGPGEVDGPVAVHDGARQPPREGGRGQEDQLEDVCGRLL